MTAGERLFQAAVWHLEDPSDESRQALAEAASAFEAWRPLQSRLVGLLFDARRQEAELLVELVNGGAPAAEVAL